MADDPDFRFYASFRDSPKRLALEEDLGPKGVVALVDLLCWVRANRVTGDLVGLSSSAIEQACRWKGKRGVLVAALARETAPGRPGWLTGAEGSYRVTGWEKRQGWAKSAPARTLAGKIAAVVKQAKRNGVTPDQWLDDVGGEDARNEKLRERARAAFDKGARRERIVTKSSNGRGNDRSTNRSDREYPVSDPDPVPDPTGGRGGRDGSAADVPRNASSASPPGMGTDPPTPCDTPGCQRPAAYGLGTPNATREHTRAWCEGHYLERLYGPPKALA